MAIGIALENKVKGYPLKNSWERRSLQQSGRRPPEKHTLKSVLPAGSAGSVLLPEERATNVDSKKISLIIPEFSSVNVHPINAKRYP